MQHRRTGGRSSVSDGSINFSQSSAKPSMLHQKTEWFPEPNAPHRSSITSLGGETTYWPTKISVEACSQARFVTSEIRSPDLASVVADCHSRTTPSTDNDSLEQHQAGHLAFGRKNWLFFGSEDGAEAGCTWLSLVLFARMPGLDVELYLRDLFRVLPLWPRRRILEVAPHCWKSTRARLDTIEMSRELGRLTIPPPLS